MRHNLIPGVIKTHLLTKMNVTLQITFRKKHYDVALMFSLKYRNPNTIDLIQVFLRNTLRTNWKFTCSDCSRIISCSTYILWMSAL